MNTFKKLITLINHDIDNENESKSFTVMLRWSYCLMVVYFVCYFLYCIFFSMYKESIHILPWLCMIVAGLFLTYRISSSKNFLIFTAVLLSWAIFSVFTFGWNCGSQHFMMPLLIMCFFSIHDSTVQKFCFMGILIILRLYLFFYCQKHQPIVELAQDASFSLQILNTIFLFLSMGIVCLIFSSTVQESEKKLWLYNQKLQTLASTDPLTKLPNRRYILDLMEKYISTHPNEHFSIALGDIDLFKNVNDTRGHNCGDYVLKEVSALFKERTEDKGHVCRWGGEEFFFFFPGMNLDAASAFMTDLNIAVSHHAMYDNLDRFYITMTFGMEEYDYQSDISTLISRADEKLYYGKEHGRNKVVF